ncbi:hypothetical protein JCM3765_005053 [Sporobolomyces pararoseus]
MVLVDGVKYACQACIKGHRSSKCTHTDRELTEIKKKGRPTSQCNHCRELRKTRSVHGKCDCIGASDSKDVKQSAKVLPNGLIDIMKQNEPLKDSPSENTKSGVNILLNPCSCRSGGKCNCCQVVSKAKTKPFPPSPPSPLFVSSDLPIPLPSNSTKIIGGCYSSKRAQQPSPQQPQPSTSTSSCCSSRRTSAPSPSYSPSLSDIQVSPLPPTPPPYTPHSSNPLFLPQTHGTLSCFCGPTCQCVGCATHDPFALKAKRKRSNSMETEEVEVMGCKCETRLGESESESRRKGKKKKECCRTSSATSTPPLSDPNIEWPELNLPNEGGTGGGGDSTPTTNSLPSLRTLLPALIDSTTQSSSSLFQSPFNSLEPPSYLDPRDQPTEEAVEESPKIACSSAFVHEIFDGNGDCGQRCMCDTDCGCRNGVEERKGENSQVKNVEELGDIAKLAEMGHFG